MDTWVQSFVWFGWRDRFQVLIKAIPWTLLQGGGRGNVTISMCGPICVVTLTLLPWCGSGTPLICFSFPLSGSVLWECGSGVRRNEILTNKHLCYLLSTIYIKHNFHVKIQGKRLRMNPHWFGSLDPDPDPHWGRKLDPDPYWSQCASNSSAPSTVQSADWGTVPAYQCCGSGSGIQCLFDPLIRYPGWVKNPDPGSGSGMNDPDHIPRA